MFFKSKVCELTNKTINFAKAEVLSQNTEYSDYINTSFKKIRSLSIGDVDCSTVKFTLGFTSSVINKIKKHTEYKKNPEAFAIKIGTQTTIWAEEQKGFIFAVATLLSLAETRELREGFIYDYPLDDVRGYRAFLPPKDRFDVFHEMVDLLAYYKYNRLVLEVGGAMEYKRHPEINEAWLRICEDVNAYSGRGSEIQFANSWSKNCFHCQNGGGSYLSQDEVRELVAYCRSRGIEVIPECPTLSHCDYLVTAHPEIAERNPEIYPDPYPDSYCPNHPDTYKYVFDILEEVIEVFEPKAIHIGHDEAYSLSICPRCKKTAPYKLYVQDIWKIHDFLAEKNIHVYMWAEKLLKSYNRGGHPIGGTGNSKSPRLYPCRDFLPKDITYIHWYWGFNPDYDNVYHDRNLDVVYGNVCAKSVKHWNMRRKRGIHGGFVSNWGSFEEEYMQRNIQYFSLLATAYAFWCDDFEDLGNVRQFDILLKELYRIKKRKIKHPITVIHTTSHKIPYKMFYDGIFIDNKDYMLGNYELTYSDGTKALLPVKFGTNISTDSYDDFTTDYLFREVAYSTLPRISNGKFVYECVYEDPNPNASVISFQYIPEENMKDVKVRVLSAEFTDKITDISQDSSTKGVQEVAFSIYD